MKTKIKFILCLAALMVAGLTISCSKGAKQPVEKQAVMPIDTTFASPTDSVNPEWNAKLDSLLRVAATAKQDTALVLLYYEIARIYSNIDFEKSKDYYAKLLDLSEQLDWNKGRYLFFKGLGVVIFREGLYDSSIVIHQQGLELAKKVNNEEWIANLNNEIGSSYMIMEWNETAL